MAPAAHHDTTQYANSRIEARGHYELGVDSLPGLTVAAAFDELTRKGEPIPATWKRDFQAGQFIPAVDYLRANRIRTLLMEEMAVTMKEIDMIDESSLSAEQMKSFCCLL